MEEKPIQISSRKGGKGRGNWKARFFSLSFSPFSPRRAARKVIRQLGKVLIFRKSTDFGMLLYIFGCKRALSGVVEGLGRKETKCKSFPVPRGKIQQRSDDGIAN